jgi:hypothetical protein
MKKLWTISVIIFSILYLVGCASYETMGKKDVEMSNDDLPNEVRSKDETKNVIIDIEGLKQSSNVYSIKNQEEDYISMIEAIENGEDPTEAFEATANGQVEIVWDKVTYFTPCPFFTFKLKGLINLSPDYIEVGIGSGNLKIINIKPFYYVDDMLLNSELERYIKYKNDFNTNILNCSKAKVEKGKVKDEKATIVREEISTTVDATCYKFKFKFKNGLFSLTPSNINNSKFNKKGVDNLLQDFEDYKKKYNKNKVEVDSSTCRD